MFLQLNFCNTLSIKIADLSEFQKVVDACKKVNCQGECAELFAKLQEAVPVVEKTILRCQELEETRLVPKKEEKEPWMDEVKGIKRRREVKQVTRIVLVSLHQMG